jgi:hypothetical protein
MYHKAKETGRTVFRSVRRIDNRHSYRGYGWQYMLRPRKKTDGRWEGLSQKHINAGRTKTYPMTTEANLTHKPKSKTPQVAGDSESITAG